MTHDDVLDHNYQSDGEYFNPGPADYAGFWIRVGASLIDFLVFLPLVFFSFYNIYNFKSVPILILTSVLGMLYKPLMEARYGATLGKMAVKIYVIGAEGAQIDLQRAVIRAIPFLLSSVLALFVNIILFQSSGFAQVDSFMELSVLQQEQQGGLANIAGMLANLFVLVSCLFVAFTTNKQGLHDKMADTLVLRREPNYAY